jgi:hypothetical protein
MPGLHPSQTTFQEIDMTDTVPTPVSGNEQDKGKPDGVNAPGRGEGGDSGGGSYQNPHTGKDGDSSVGGFFGHGGQTDIGYHGGGQAGTEGSETDNATTRGDRDDTTGDTDAKSGPTGPDQQDVSEYPRSAVAAGRPIEVIDTSGVAAAEASGTTGKDGADAAETEHPGSG